MLVPITILASWVLVITVELRLAGGGHAGTGAHCIRNLVALAAPPGLLLHAMLRRAAPLDRGESALLATLAAAALADAGTRFVCRNDGALHILAWHCGVVLWLAAVGFIVGRRLGVTRRRR
jgi:hypothetical protein